MNKLDQLYSNKKQILKNSLDFFVNSSSLIPKIGIELEFFLLEKTLDPIRNHKLLEEIINDLKLEILKNFPFFYEIEKEQGLSQVEIKSIFTENLLELAKQIEDCRKFITEFVKKKNLVATFAAQPFIDDCGSALQFNISLHDDKDNFSPEVLNFAVNGLLEKTNSIILLLVPNKEDYQRFSLELNYNLFKKGKYSAPINLTCGFDNRTCAIRIKKEKNFVRLEYRVASAAADPYLSIAAILEAVLYGIKNPKKPVNMVYGNAFDEQYGSEKLCQTIEEAIKNFNCLNEF